MYKKEFQITDDISNNSFSFSKRKNPTIYVPKIIEGEIYDVKIGNKIVFEDFNENEELKSCVGLKNFIRTTHPTTKKPIIIVDNHNHVFYFWYEAKKNGVISDKATLIHIDQHKDMRKPENNIDIPIPEGDIDIPIPEGDIDIPIPEGDIDIPNPEGDIDKCRIKNLEYIFKYTNSVLNVGNYIPPAIEEGLIGEVISITSENELKKKSSIFNFQSSIVNIDLDFWAPEMNYIDSKLKTDITKQWMEKADLITIATSPFFIDQKLALKVLKDLFYNDKY